MSSASQLPLSSFAPALASPATDLFPISVGQYHAMIEQGILPTGASLELLQGLLVRRMTILPPHSVSVELTREALAALLPAGWFPVTQQPLTLADSEPEPDVMVVRGTRRDYRRRHPTVADVGLVVEVADDSLERDRGWKQDIYAQAGIPIYWIVNLRERVVEVYRHPQRGASPRYQPAERFAEGSEVPFILEGVERGRIAVEGLLP